MSDIKTKVSLLTLPHELFSNILPDLSQLESVKEKNCTTPIGLRWLGLRLAKESDRIGAKDHQQHLYNETIDTLRALTQTCKELRALALPLLWGAIHVVTPNELAVIRRTLEVSPDIAPHVRSFCFMLRSERTLCAKCFSGEKAMLDQACRQKYFIAMVRSRYDPGYNSPLVPDQCFARTCPPPEEDMYEPEGPPEMSYMDKWTAAERRRRATRAAKVDADVVAIVKQLTSLTTFGWCSPAAPMPQGVCAALARLDTLTSLHVHMLALRRRPDILPLWNVTGKLKYLSLQMAHDPPGWEAEVDEMHDVAIEQPSSEVQDQTDPNDELNPYIASRAIVAAAKGGQLRKIKLNNYKQSPFAIRALVPRWVEMESWEIDVSLDTPSPRTDWLKAAASLRGVLVHASLWLGTEVKAGARHDRTLTREEIQAIQHSFQPDSDFELKALWHTTGPPHPVTRYIRWIGEDDKLAEQVSDAWNAVVKRGEADLCPCACEVCSPPEPILDSAPQSPVDEVEDDFGW